MSNIMSHLSRVSKQAFIGCSIVSASGCLGYLGTYIIYPMMTSPPINPLFGAAYMGLNATMQLGCKLLPEKIQKIAHVCSFGFAALATFKITGVVLPLKSIVLINVSTVLAVVAPPLLAVAAIVYFFAIPILFILACVAIYKFVKMCVPTPVSPAPVTSSSPSSGGGGGGSGTNYTSSSGAAAASITGYTNIQHDGAPLKLSEVVYGPFAPNDLPTTIPA